MPLPRVRVDSERIAEVEIKEPTMLQMHCMWCRTHYAYCTLWVGPVFEQPRKLWSTVISALLRKGTLLYSTVQQGAENDGNGSLLYTILWQCAISPSARTYCIEPASAVIKGLIKYCNVKRLITVLVYLAVMCVLYCTLEGIVLYSVSFYSTRLDGYLLGTILYHTNELPMGTVLYYFTVQYK